MVPVLAVYTALPLHTCQVSRKVSPLTLVEPGDAVRVDFRVPSVGRGTAAWTAPRHPHVLVPGRDPSGVRQLDQGSDPFQSVRGHGLGPILSVTDHRTETR
eukprot:gene19468-23011_t